MHLGSSEWCARVLQEAVGPNASAGEVEAAARADRGRPPARARRVFPGSGTGRTPGATRARSGCSRSRRRPARYGSYCALLERVSELASEGGRLLPANVTGAIAAIASDMGFRWQITRAFALIGRVLGALGHIQEEMDDPISDELIRLIQKSVDDEPDRPQATWGMSRYRLTIDTGGTFSDLVLHDGADGRAARPQGPVHP